MGGALDETRFNAKNTELRDRVANLASELESTDRRKDETAGLALNVFELSQSLMERWLTAEYAANQQSLEWVCSDLVTSGASVAIITRKPFETLVEGLLVEGNGKKGTRLELFVGQAAQLQAAKFGMMVNYVHVSTSD